MSVLYVVQIFIFCHFFANNWCASDGSREAFPGLCDEKMDATYVAPINFEDTCQFRHFPIRAEQLSRLPSLDVRNIFFSPTNRTRMRIRHLIVLWFLLCSLSSSSLPCSFDADLFHTQVLTSARHMLCSQHRLCSCSIHTREGERKISLEKGSLRFTHSSRKCTW